jgi:hypothetical protein
MAERKMIENLLPWRQAQQYLIATGYSYNGKERDREVATEGTTRRVH